MDRTADIYYNLLHKIVHRKFVAMKSIVTEVVFVAVAGLLCAGLPAADYVWTGAEDARWVNANNWTDSSGNPVAKCPGVAASGDETADWTAARAEADTAIFSGASSHTTIDLAGLFAISNVKFEGASIPAYVLGTDDTQTLPLRPDAKFMIEASVVNLPSVAAKLPFPLGYTTSTPTVIFQNKTTGTLTLSGFTAGVRDPNSAQPYYNAQIYLMGTGGYSLGGNSISGVDLYASTSGKVLFAGNFTGLRRFCLQGTKDIEIAKCVSVCANRSLDHYVSSDAMSATDIATISGEGEFHLVSKSNNKQYFKYMNGNVVFACPIAVDASTWGGIIMDSGNGGSLEFKGNILSGFTGPVEISAAVAFRAASIGANGGDTKAGTGSLVKLSNGGQLEYTGAGETTTRNLEIAGGVGALMNSGTGAWTVSSPIAVSAASTLKLGGNSSVPATLMSDVTHESLSFVKAGTGTWTVSGEVDVTATASLEAGKLVLAEASKEIFAGTTDLAIKGGASLEFESGIAAATLPQLTAGSNGGMIVVPDGCTVTLGAVPVDGGGVVDFDLRGSGKVVCAAAAGTVTPCLTVGGLTGVFKADGTLYGDKYPAIATAIAARGGVIPDGASAQVAIAEPGDVGPVTLEKPVTSVDLLVQKGSVPAIVSMVNGVLCANTLSMLARVGVLTVGEQAGEGVLQAGNVMTLENFSKEEALTVNATLTADASGSKLAKTGCGEAAVADLAGTWSAEPTEGRLSLSGTGDFKLTGAVAGGARLALSDLSNVAEQPAANTISGLLVGKSGMGILEIGPGTAVTNRLYVGHGGCGAVYQTGGYFYNRGKSGDGAQYRPGIGFDGYGYYELRGGVYAEGGGTRQMCATANSVGVLDIYGGAVKASGSDQLWLNAKAGATGIVVLRGGSYEVGGTARLPDNRGVFCMTQEGADSVASFNTIQMGCASNSTSIVNLNAGEFSAMEICRWNVANAQSIFNFNGGTMKAKSDKALFRVDSASRVMIDHVMSYGRGAMFDTDGYNVSLGMPVESPTGMGVASIGWTAADAMEKYIGAPAVVISGDGFGATACADFDYQTGCVTNIRVTCSGSGYTEGNVTATLKYNSTSRTLPVTLGPVIPGGLVKKGAGVLTLDQPNAYVGETAVEGGTLKVGVEGAIPSGGMLRLDGGTLDLNGQTPMFSGICGAGGAVVNGAVTLAGEWVADVADLGEGTALNGDLAFADDASIRVTSVDMLDPKVRKRYTLVKTTNGHAVSGMPQIVGELPKDWKVSVSSCSVRLHYCEGLMMIVR